MLRECYERTFDEDVQPSTSDCPDCGGRVTTTTHETVCDDCGLVLDDEPIDHGPEWRSFADDQTNPRRTGAPLTATRHDRGLSTEIGTGQDANGNRLSREKERQLNRLRREHSRATIGSKRNRNRAAGNTEIGRICGALGLENGFREQACQLFRTAQDAGLLPGRSIEAVATACVYATCRCNGLPRTLGEFEPLARVRRDRIEHAYSVLNRELGLPAEPMRPEAYLPRLASAVGLSDEARQRAREYVAVAHDAGLVSGRKPIGIAAACLYAAAEERCEAVTQVDLADAADISPITLRSRWRELCAAREDAHSSDAT